jgi:SPP1 family predicted phage head-tail adaptor
MRHKEVIYLISYGSSTLDSVGNQIVSTTERLVYANEFYVNGSEFYRAAQAGLKAEKQLEVYSFEYNGEEKLKHNNVVYKIIRAETRGDKTRITCEKVVGDG